MLHKTGFQRDFFDALSRKPLANQGASLSNQSPHHLTSSGRDGVRNAIERKIIQTKRSDWLEALFRELDERNLIYLHAEM